MIAIFIDYVNAVGDVGGYRKDVDGQVEFLYEEGSDSKRWLIISLLSFSIVAIGVWFRS